MPSFGKSSMSRLNSAHGDLQTLFLEVVKDFDCSVICGHRGEEDQNKAVKGGFSKVKYPNSMHNKVPSLAVDVIPWPVDWEDTDRMYYFAGFVMAKANELYRAKKMLLKVRWGGDWDRDTEIDDQKFIDLPHFELIPGSMEQEA